MKSSTISRQIFTLVSPLELSLLAGRAYTTYTDTYIFYISRILDSLLLLPGKDKTLVVWHLKPMKLGKGNVISRLVSTIDLATL